jgi:hypothetical protein
MDGTPLLDSRNRVQEVVRSAARRQFAVVAIEQLAFCFAPVLSGGILLLLLGTQILHWYWLGLLAAAGISLAIVRIRARTISRYRAAQLLDKHLRLADSLSTAWFLLQDNNLPRTGATDFQLKQAEQLAAGIQVADGFPLVWRRAWALTGALAAVAFGLFAIRYLVTKSLSFEQSLIPVQITPVFERIEDRLFASDRSPGDSTGEQTRNADRAAGQLPDQETSDILQAEAGQTGQATDPNAKASATTATESDKSSNPLNSQGQNRDGNTGNSQAEEKQSDQPAGNRTDSQTSDLKQQSTGGQQGAQGLMDKMKDALSSFMAKMRQNSSQQAQQMGRQSEEEKAASQSAAKPQAGEQQDASNRQPSDQQSSEGQPQAQATERAQASQGRSSDSLPEKGSDAHSGIGRQDGDKAVKEAEQLQAMGKLAEIIGKRSASLTGDMTVETSSSKQQLKTAYSNKLAQHSDSGGEINRDEIPLEDQQYVRTYMELIRKQPKTAR